MQKNSLLFSMFLVGLLSVRASVAMNAERQPNEGGIECKLDLALVVHNAAAHIGLNILRENPFITGRQLVTKYGAIMSKRSLRTLFESLWNIRRSVVNNAPAVRIFNKLNSEKHGNQLEDLRLFVCTGYDVDSLSDALRNVACIAEISCRTITADDLAMNRVTRGAHLSSLVRSMNDAVKLVCGEAKKGWSAWLPKAFTYWSRAQQTQRIEQENPVILLIPEFDRLAELHHEDYDDEVLQSFLQLYTQNHQAIIVGVSQKQDGEYPALIKQNSIRSYSDCPIIIADDRRALLKCLTTRYAQEERTDLMQTIFELAQRTAGMNVAQLDKIIDEADFEASMEQSVLYREHIIAAYNRLRRMINFNKAPAQQRSEQNVKRSSKIDDID